MTNPRSTHFVRAWVIRTQLAALAVIILIATFVWIAPILLGVAK